MNEAEQAGASIAQLLVEYRRAAGWTQEDLAAESGLSHRTISDMERGVARRPQHRTLRALAGALQLGDAELRRFLAAGGERVVPAPRPASDAADSTGPVAPAGSNSPAGGAEPESVPVLPTSGPPPNTLPPESAHLTGRDNELEAACGLVAQDRPVRNRPRIVCVHGAPGIGKTSFTLHCAHRLAPSYQDGALFVDLRGMDADPLPAEQALGQLLMALGVNQLVMPYGTDERAGMLRSLLADRQVLLLLDNVADEAQVRPLLPAAAGSLVLTTSRRVLAGLTDADRVFLGVLGDIASAALLGDIVGQQRVNAEPDAVAKLVELCGGLPLALRIAGNRLATRPGWKVANLVSQMAEERRRLTALTAGDLQVRSAFAMSYRQCSATERTMFRRLSLIPGADFPVELAAVVGETDPDEAAATLEALVNASLLLPGGTPDRYTLHDLLAVFAAERLRLEEPPETVAAVTDRMHAWVLGEGARQGRLLFAPQHELADPAWLDTEKVRWTTAVHAGPPAAVVEFCLAMQWYPLARPDWGMWPRVFDKGIAAARTLDRPIDLAMLINLQVCADAQAGAAREQTLGRHEEARRLAHDSGDSDAQAWAVYYRARLELIYYRPQDAADFARHARALFAEADSRIGQHAASLALGSALHLLGRYADAVVAHRDALDALDEDQADRGVARLRLAKALEALGEIRAAQAEYAQVPDTFPMFYGLAEAGLGRCAAALGETYVAKDHFEKALAIFSAAHELMLKATTLASVADIIADAYPERARQYREHALRLCADVDSSESAELAETLVAKLGHVVEHQGSQTLDTG